MAEQERKVRWPDGVSVTLPALWGRQGATYYWNPGSPTAPHVTFTRTLGVPGVGANAVFLRKDMTSADTLGYGMSGNVSTIVPSVTLNGTFPDDGGSIPKPWNSRVTSIEAGIGTPHAASLTKTSTPQQIADFLSRYVIGPVIGPAMGPHDELSPFVRTLQSSNATVGTAREAPIHYVGARAANPLGDGMGDWQSSVVPNRSPTVLPSPGGLLGLLEDYLRDR